MGLFGRDNAFDLMVLSDIANGDEDDPATKAARDILGLPRESAGKDSNDDSGEINTSI